MPPGRHWLSVEPASKPGGKFGVAEREIASLGGPPRAGSHARCGRSIVGRAHENKAARPIGHAAL
jgi:hypothetical protein